MPRIRSIRKGPPSEKFIRDPCAEAPGDEVLLAPLAALYRHLLPPGGAILDIMSGCLCHLPPDIAYGRVVGIGTDPEMLAQNPFLDDWYVLDLNRDPALPLGTGEFEGATICVGLHCLTRPVEVLREIGRVLRPGAPLVIAFSRRAFGSRAIACWRMLNTDERFHVLRCHFAEAGNWNECECRSCCKTSPAEPLYAVIARSRGNGAG